MGAFYYWRSRRIQLSSNNKVSICLRETKLQSFQYKIIQRIINCNKKLFDMTIKNSPICTYCDQTDDIGHLFFLCKDVYQFWRDMYLVEYAWLWQGWLSSGSFFSLPALTSPCSEPVLTLSSAIWLVPVIIPYAHSFNIFIKKGCIHKQIYQH